MHKTRGSWYHKQLISKQELLHWWPRFDSHNKSNQRAIQSSEGLGRLVGWSQVGCWWRTMQEPSRYFCKPKDDFLPHTSLLSYQHMGNCNQPAERLLIRRKKHSHSNLLWSIFGT